tara:strand:+ start:1169 stop:1600 length:432 start_codon:yes stop_codon:yes gene_type:complete
MQFVTADVEQIHEKKKKYLAIFAGNKFSRPVHALACFRVNRQTLKHVRTSWYFHFMQYKSRSRTMASVRVQHDCVKNWAGRNNANEDCIRIIKYTEAAVNLRGQYLETVARRMQYSVPCFACRSVVLQAYCGNERIRAAAKTE